MVQQTHFYILSSFENVADLAESVSNICASEPHVKTEEVEMLRLCVAEALNNIVEHAYSGCDGKPIYADVSVAPEACTVLLIDEGKPMPGGEIPTASPEFDLDDIENLPEGGFGWVLIRSQMDSIEYDRREGCNVLRLEKHLST